MLTIIFAFILQCVPLTTSITSTKSQPKSQITRSYASVPLLANPSISIDMGLNSFLSLGYDGTNVTIAVLDSGVDLHHIQLDDDGNLSTNDDYYIKVAESFVDTEPAIDLNGHGTPVIGLIKMRQFTYNGKTYGGIAKGADVWSIKVLDMGGYGSDIDVVEGLDYCIQNADKLDIVSMSLGINDEPIESIESKVRELWNLGVTVVIAAGNDGEVAIPYYTVATPSTALEPISVGAMYDYESIGNFSSIGPSRETNLIKPEVIAPGTDLVSIAASNETNNDLFVMGISGTSFSTPIISAGIAIVLSALPYRPSSNLIKSALIASCTPLEGYDIYMQGAGVPDFYRMWQLLSDPSFDGISSIAQTLEFPNFFDHEKESWWLEYREVYPEIYFPYVKNTLIVGIDPIETLSYEVESTISKFIRVKDFPTISQAGQYVYGIDFVEPTLVFSFPGTFTGEINIMEGAVIVDTVSIVVTVSFMALLKATFGWILTGLLTAGILGFVILRRAQKSALNSEFKVTCPDGWECECDKKTMTCIPIRKLP